MSYTPVAHVESLRIGTVDFVAPDEIKALLDIEAPESIALNAGGVRPFPRVNGYVLMPVDGSYLVGQIEWLTVERSSFPKRRGIQDFGLIDLPYPLRRVKLSPLGTLFVKAGEEERYLFRRGADSLPSIGTSVLLPTDLQLRSIVESGMHRRVRIGVSPLAAGAEVRIDPDRLFGRHLAVLGNTGSGKSCTVAGLIHWSIEAAAARVPGGVPNARFIVLDPNGEYSRAFSAGDSKVKARVFSINANGEADSLQVPLWLWNSAEWCSFTKASAKTQRPVLHNALRIVRDGSFDTAVTHPQGLRRYLRTLLSIVRVERNAGAPWGAFPRPKSFFEKIEKWRATLEADLAKVEGNDEAQLRELVEKLDDLCAPRRVKFAHMDFSREEIDELIEVLTRVHAAFGGGESDGDGGNIEAPVAFTADDLLRALEVSAEMLNVSEYAETLILRTRSLLRDTRLSGVVADGVGVSLQDWLEGTIGADNAETGCVTVIDMSLVPSEIVHLVTAVIARTVFEALQRYRRCSAQVLPTVLVMEEAHTFIKRYKDDAEDQDLSSVCCQVFERIAREGRKYGLGLLLSSQRPSELSSTVLSQCNTFLLHRLSNDRDQELVHRLLPDSLHGLLRELPTLPSQHAILLGWASELPVLVRIDDLPTVRRPHSDDPDYWNVWTGRDSDGAEVRREIDWGALAAEWQGGSRSSTDELGTVNEVEG